MIEESPQIGLVSRHSTPSRPVWFVLTVLTLMLAPMPALRAKLVLSGLFSDHMVLQRNRPISIWGWADSGEKIRVTFAGQKAATTTGADGKWMVRLPPMPADAKPQRLVVNGKNTRIVLKDVLVGDVWVCGGQSNMQYPLYGWGAGGTAQAVAQANIPLVRLYTVPTRPDLKPVRNVHGQWQICTSKTARNFSAVGYYFGRYIQRKLNIPIGLLESCVGGTYAQDWMSLGVLNTVPHLRAQAGRQIAAIKRKPADDKAFPGLERAWEKRWHCTDPGNRGYAKGWASPDYDDKGWKTVTLPGSWAQFGEKTGGVFWIRKSVNVPAHLAGHGFRLSINWVNDEYDTVYFNGVEVGHTGLTPPYFYDVQRFYHVPGKLLKAGLNVVAVRLVSPSCNSGVWLWGQYLGVPGKIPGNDWKFRVESLLPALPPAAIKTRPHVNRGDFTLGTATSLYNGMIHPLMPLAIKGVIWYQGENNTDHPQDYEQILSLLIRDWRTRWGQGNFPFYIVQLPGFGSPLKDPNGYSSWAILREAQARTAEDLNNCGLAVTIDLGKIFTIHPPDKRDVGDRLGLVAMAKTYGQKLAYSGPRYASVKLEGHAIRIYFKHVDGGLIARGGGPLKYFAIAGAKGKYIWAHAQISGDTVVVSSPAIAHPQKVRYAWGNDPVGVNLFNKAGLPAAPFEANVGGTPE